MVAKYTATVINGRLVLDEPTTGLPEGSKVEVTVDDRRDGELDSAEREALWAAIDRGAAQADRGEGIPWEDAMVELRRRQGALET